jgi:hypothetical protein
MNKKSALKHTGDGHMLLNEEAHKEAHGGQSPDQQQPSQPDWLRDIDTVKGLKVPSYNKLKEDEVRKLYRDMKAAGYNVKAITATLNAIKQKRYNAYQSSVSSYNKKWEEYNQSEKKLLDLSVNREVEQNPGLTESQIEQMRLEMKQNRINTGQFGDYQLSYKDEAGNTLKYDGDVENIEPELVSKEEFNKRQKVDNNIKELDLLGDIDFNYVLNTEEETFVPYLNDRLKQINNSLTQEGVEFIAEEAGVFDAAKIYKVVDGKKTLVKKISLSESKSGFGQEFVRGITFGLIGDDRDRNQRAEEELQDLKNQIKSSVERSTLEKHVKDRTEEDLKQIRNGKYIINKDDGLQYSQNEVVTKYLEQGGKFEFLGDNKNLTSKSYNDFLNYTNEFTGYDGEGEDVLKEVLFNRKGDNIIGADPIVRKIKNLIVDPETQTKLDNLNEEVLKSKLQEIFGITANAVSYNIDDKVNITIGEETFVIDPDNWNTDDSESISTLYNIYDAYRKLSPQELTQNIVSSKYADGMKVGSGTTYNEETNQITENIELHPDLKTYFKSVKRTGNKILIEDVNGNIVEKELQFEAGDRIQTLQPKDFNTIFNALSEYDTNLIDNLAVKTIKENDIHSQKVKATIDKQMDNQVNLDALIEGSPIKNLFGLNLFDGDYRKDAEDIPENYIAGTSVGFSSVLNGVIENGGENIPKNVQALITNYFGLHGDRRDGYTYTDEGSGMQRHLDTYLQNRKNKVQNFSEEDFRTYAKENGIAVTDADIDKIQGAINAITEKEGADEEYTKVWNNLNHDVTDQRERVFKEKEYSNIVAKDPSLQSTLTVASILNKNKNVNEKLHDLQIENFATETYLAQTFTDNKVLLDNIAKEISTAGAYVDPVSFTLKNTNNLPKSRVKELNKELQNIKQKQDDAVDSYKNIHTENNIKINELHRDGADYDAIAIGVQKERGFDVFKRTAANSFETLALAVPALFQNEAAIQAYTSNQRALEIILPPPVAYDELSSKLDYKEFVGRTVGEQAANTVLALASGGIGAAANMSVGALTTSQGVLFGLQSAGMDMASTTSAKYRADAAKGRLFELNKSYEYGDISEEQYNKQVEALHNVIIENDSSLLTRSVSALSKGVVEGVVMKYIGTATNANAIFGVTDDVVLGHTNNILRRTAANNGKKMFNIVKGNFTDGLKAFAYAQASEVVEETVAELGQGVVEAVVMDTQRAINNYNLTGEFDYKGLQTLKETFMSLDDIAISSLVNGGGMSTISSIPGIGKGFYDVAGIATNGLANWYDKTQSTGMNKVYSDLGDLIVREKSVKQKLIDAGNPTNPDGSDNVAYTRARLELESIRESMAINGQALVGDFVQLTKKDKAELFANQLQAYSMEAAAKVKPGMNPKQKMDKIESYAKTLGKAKGNEFLEAYKGIQESSAEIAGKVFYDSETVYDVYGEAGKEIYNQFKNDRRRSKFKNASERDKVAIVGLAIKQNDVNLGMQVAENSFGKSFVQEQVEKNTYSVQNWNYDKTKPTTYIDENGKEQVNLPTIPVTFEQYQRITGAQNRDLQAEKRVKEKIALDPNQGMLAQYYNTKTLYDKGKQLQSHILELAGDLSQVETIEFQNDQELYDLLVETFMEDNPGFNNEEPASPDNNDKIVDWVKVNETFDAFKKGEIKGAFVPGKKYIVNDKAAADANLASGDLLQGTMMFHEVGHAIDLLALQGDTIQETNENIRQYSYNLFAQAASSVPNVHKRVIKRLQGNDTYNYAFEDAKDFETMEGFRNYMESVVDQNGNRYFTDTDIDGAIEKIYKEYTQYLGEYILHEAENQNLYGEKIVDPDVDTLLKNTVEVEVEDLENFKPDSPSKAMQYLVSYVKGAQEGNIGKVAGVLAVNKKFQQTETLMSQVRKESEGLLDNTNRDKLVQEVNDLYTEYETADDTRKNTIRFEIAEKYRGMAEARFDANLKTAPSEGARNNLLTNKPDIISDMLYGAPNEGAKNRAVIGMVEDFVKERQKYGNLAAYINTLFKRRSLEAFVNYDNAYQQQLDFASNQIAQVETEMDTELDTKKISTGDIVLNESIASNDPNPVVRQKAEQHTQNVQAIAAEDASVYEGKSFKDVKDLDVKSTVEMMVGNDNAVFVDDGSPVWRRPKMQELLGTSIVDSIVKKLDNNANLNAQEIKAIQRFIRRHTDLNPAASNLLWKAMPEGHELDVVNDQARPGKATGVNRVLLEKGYTKSEKRIGNSYPQYKKPVNSVSQNDFKGWFGINPRNEADFVGREANISDTVKAFIRTYGGITTKQAIKKYLADTGTDITKNRLSFENGMSGMLFSKVTAENMSKFPNLREANVNFLSLMEKTYGFDTYMPTMKYGKKSSVNKLYDLGNKTKIKEMMTEAGIPSGLQDDYYNELFGDTGQIKNMAQIKRAKQLAGDNYVNMPSFLELMDGRVDDYIVQAEVQKILGLDSSIIDGMTDVDIVNTARDNIKQIAIFFAGKNKIPLTKKFWQDSSKDVELKTKFIQYILDMSGAYSPAGQIGNRLLTIVEEGKNAYKLSEKDITKISDNRKMVTEGMGDYVALINNLVPGVDIIPTKLAGKTKQQPAGKRVMNGVTRKRTSIDNTTLKKLYPGLAKTYAESTAAIKNELKKDANGNWYLTTDKARQEQADRFREVYKNSFESNLNRLVSQDDSYSLSEFQVWIAGESSGMNASGRRGAYLYGISMDIFNVADKNLGTDFEYDHAKPNNTLMIKSAELAKQVVNGDISINEAMKQLDVFYEDYHVNAITKEMDKAIKTAGLQSFIDGKYQPGNPVLDLGWSSRLFNGLVKFDPRLRPILVVSGKDAGKVIGNDYVLPQHRINAENTIQPNMSALDFDKTKVLNKAVLLSRAINHKTESRGMSAFDFDETLIDKGENTIIATKGDSVVEITSGNWPLEGPKYAAEGYEFDFSDFINVKGGIEGPLMQKFRNRIEKYGIENNYILTARPQEAAPAIKAWLETQGINMPIENITGLGDSTGEAKALWIANKFSEGYNDIYFVDDALPNVEAVADMIDQLDIKGKSVQAKIQFSREIAPTTENIIDNSINANLELNRIIEQTTGIGAEKRFSDAQAKIRGSKKGKFGFFVPPSAEDFKGLMYRLLAKGKEGERQMAFFKKALFDPYNRGYQSLNSDKQSRQEQYRSLLKNIPGIKSELKQKVPNTDFTVEQAVRVYLWNKAGFEIPGLSKRDQNILTKHIRDNNNLVALSENLSLIIGQEEGYVQPNEFWLVESILSDLQKVNNEISRADHLAEFVKNREEMFGTWDVRTKKLVGPNINKLEAAFGTNYRDALEDMLWRMEFGSKREAGKNKLVNRFNNWANQSVGAIMFFNMRSALLQTISSVNYINWSDNNPLKAASAFANQKQFWKDFSMIFNSDMLKQRRAGNQRGINEAELAQAVAGSKDKAKAALNWLLTKGFLPTQIADSFAIASGGATFYRNRVKAYLKQGLSQEQAESQAFRDFQEVTEESQQSSRPDMISQQQASPLGRYILAFKNTPMQYARLMKKAFLDLKNNRGDWKSNVSKIIYYGAVQNLIFNGLQAALGAMIGDEEDEEDKTKQQERIVNGMIDSILGGLGLGGNVVMTIKNTIKEYLKQKEKGWNADHTYTMLRLVGLSPTIGSKLRKVYSGIQTEKFNEDVIKEMSLLDIDNPVYSAIANVISGVTNIPLDRLVKKVDNIDAAITEDISVMERLALLLGWNTWDLGIEDQDIIAVEEEIKEKKDSKRKQKEKKKEKEKKQKVNQAKEEENKKKDDGRCIAISKGGSRCKNEAISGSYCTIHAKVEQGETEVQCSKIKSNGERCKMKTKAKSGLCYYHD